MKKLTTDEVIEKLKDCNIDEKSEVITKLSTTQIKELFNNINEDILELLKKDIRKSVQSLVTRYEKQQAAELKLQNDFLYKSRYEKEIWNCDIEYIAGVDEVGRGPLAGPVVTAAVILPKDFILLGIDDSKKLSEKKLNEFHDYIMEHAISVKISYSYPDVIDEINILQATIKAMTESIQGLNPKPQHLLIDAVKLPHININQTSIIKGDANSISIAAASIIAKVTRDKYMTNLSKTYPHYGFERNVGYGTKEHLEAIEKYGVIEGVHRKSFEPIKTKVALNA